MKNMQRFSFGLVWLAVCGMCLPTSLVMGNEATGRREAGPTNARQRTAIHDVALQPGGLLVGQVLDESLQPMGGQRVAILMNGQPTAEATTDAHGIFAVSGMRGGVHQVVTGESSEVCRLWAPGTAPPHAVSHLRFVPGKGDVIRGQWGPPPAYNSLLDLATNPFVVGGVVITAVGVPILLNNLDDDDDDNGS